eukprot:TRINITY_DN18265_c0_g1_i2.p2 TRINITY_DN18265_c0_g1~~TRINITY_DN18265_c0_g1_i2.p2  ORF type:complete len:100 (-),score=17.05 TRINITY_DN18265_c0_g1_i2:73-351(-)
MAAEADISWSTKSQKHLLGDPLLKQYRSLYTDEWEPNRKSLERLKKNKTIGPLRSGQFKGLTVVQAIARAEQVRRDLLLKKKRLEVMWIADG